MLLLDDEDQTSMDCKGKPSPNIQVTKQIVVPPDFQTSVEVVKKYDGVILVDQDSKIFTNRMCPVAARVPNLLRYVHFNFLVANFGSPPDDISRGKQLPRIARTMQTS